MLLALDIGNTNVTIGIFEGERLRTTWRIATDVERLADEYAVLILGLLRNEGIGPTAIHHAVMASVVPDLAPIFEQLCSRYFEVEPLVVGTGTKTGVRVLYDNPRDVGADRIVDVVAALKLYGPPPLIIVDFGTATVFDAVSAEGDYLGGAIAPGIGIASEALFERAAKLYRVRLERPASAIGKNTVAAIQSGTLYGYVGLLEGMVGRFKAELGGKARVVATGGWAELLSKETRIFDAVDPNLTLTGLRLIHEAHMPPAETAHAAG
jgi:type III pantothenate kinase